MFDQNDPHQDLPEQMFAPLRGRNAPGCVAGSWKFGAGQRRQACPATIKKKKKKKKKNTSPFIISRFAPESQVFFEKFFKKIFTIFIDFCFRI